MLNLFFRIRSMFQLCSRYLLQIHAHPRFLVLTTSSRESLVVELHGFSLQEERLGKMRGSWPLPIPVLYRYLSALRTLSTLNSQR